MSQKLRRWRWILPVSITFAVERQRERERDAPAYSTRLWLERECCSIVRKFDVMSALARGSHSVIPSSSTHPMPLKRRRKCLDKHGGPILCRDVHYYNRVLMASEPSIDFVLYAPVAMLVERASFKFIWNHDIQHRLHYTIFRILRECCVSYSALAMGETRV